MGTPGPEPSRRRADDDAEADTLGQRERVANEEVDSPLTDLDGPPPASESLPPSCPKPLVSHPTHRLARAIACLALCVLGLGLPRFLLLCTPVDGVTHLEFALRPDGCCADHDHAGPHDPAATEPAADHGSRGQPDAVAAASPCDCEHTELGTELSRLPRFVMPDACSQQPLCGLATALDRFPKGEPEPRLRPPSTGPPRPERRTEQLTSTVLRQ